MNSHACRAHSARPAGTVRPSVLQLLLFDATSAEEIANYRPLRRPPQKKTRRKPKGLKPKGLQYKLRMSQRATPRKIAYRPHAKPEKAGNAFEWGTSEVRRLHSFLLTETLDQLRHYLEVKGSIRAAEIMAWIDRTDSTDPFAFETCCALHEDEDGPAPLDPDEMRNRIKRWVRTLCGSDLPHAALLRKGIVEAEHGNLDAIAWVMSDGEGPMSFSTCCQALGFQAEQARDEIHIPALAGNDLKAVEARTLQLDAA